MHWKCGKYPSSQVSIASNKDSNNMSCKVPFNWTFFSILRKKKKKLVQALINPDVYVCARQLM